MNVSQLQVGLGLSPRRRPRAARRARDLYESAGWMPRALLASVPELGGRVCECCVGLGAISRVLETDGGLSVVTNDIDPSMPADFHADASLPAFWADVGPVDWVVSNIPWAAHLSLPIVRHAVASARVGVALLLRLSFLEPTAHGSKARQLSSGARVPASDPRGPWLAAHPLSRLLVLPRYSFTGTGTDSVTAAWMIWARVPLSGPPIVLLHRADETYARAMPELAHGRRRSSTRDTSAPAEARAEDMRL